MEALAAAYPSYEVGAYYFSGWSHGQNDNLNPLLTGRFHGSEPLIGWYDDTQALVDKSIDQAANAGIGFFAFDWYNTAQSPYLTDKSLNEALGFYLTSRQRPRLKFCIDFIDQAPFIPAAVTRDPTTGRATTHPAAIHTWIVRTWPGLIKTWIGYFKQPDYVRVDGKPLFMVFSPEHMREIFGGSAGVRAGLDDLRARVQAAGLPGVTIAVAATIAPRSNPARVALLQNEGYDVTTGYNYHSLGPERYRTPVPYEYLVRENMGVWNRVAQAYPYPYIPVITTGWDQRYSIREQRTAIIYGGRTPQKVACFAVQARHWIDTHPTRTTKERIVMVFAWNEIGEGGAIIPDVQDGYAYANAIHTVFGSPGHPPATPDYCSTRS